MLLFIIIICIIYLSNVAIELVWDLTIIYNCGTMTISEKQSLMGVIICRDIFLRMKSS